MAAAGQRALRTAARRMRAAGIAARPPCAALSVRVGSVDPLWRTVAAPSGAGWRVAGPPRRTFGALARAHPGHRALTDADLEHFRSFLPESAVVTDAADLAPHNVDWMNTYHGHSRLMLRPGNTEDVSRILAYCNEQGLPVVPQGGNTGLVGGGVPMAEEIILSLSRLNKVISFDDGSGVLVADAGCVLETLDLWLRDRDHIMPLDLGAKGTCQIGGNASTNAGGLRYIRYGSLHGSILGLEVVKADGTVLDLLTTLRKDNVGFDLKQLFIGSEGTLGVITKVAIQAAAKPSATNVGLFACPSFDAVRDTLRAAKRHLGEILSAVEFVDRPAMEMVLDHVDGARDPLDAVHPFYVIVETSGSSAEHDAAKLEAFLDIVMGGDEPCVHDGAIAQDGTQARALWMLRENVAVGLSHAGTVYKYDLSLPHSHMYALVEETRERIAHREDATVVGYGHLGDCNLHLNVSTPAGAPDLRHELEPFLFEWTAAQRGSISAEHGLGQSKAHFMSLQRPPEVIQVMRQLKAVMDPKGILNPNKVLTLEA